MRRECRWNRSIVLRRSRVYLNVTPGAAPQRSLSTPPTLSRVPYGRTKRGTVGVCRPSPSIQIRRARLRRVLHISYIHIVRVNYRWFFFHSTYLRKVRFYATGGGRKEEYISTGRRRRVAQITPVDYKDTLGLGEFDWKLIHLRDNGFRR